MCEPSPLGLFAHREQQILHCRRHRPLESGRPGPADPGQ
jgi:hypothetical protein